jgi:hypothetical protein
MQKHRPLKMAHKLQSQCDAITKPRVQPFALLVLIMSSLYATAANKTQAKKKKGEGAANPNANAVRKAIHF